MAGQADPLQAHERDEPVELTGHRLDAADPRAQGLLFQHDLEAALAGVEQALAFQAGCHGLIQVVGDRLQSLNNSAHCWSVSGSMILLRQVPHQFLGHRDHCFVFWEVQARQCLWIGDLPAL